MRILLAGANGMLARAVRRHFQGHTLFLTDVGEMNILDKASIRRVSGIVKPELIINCAAYTAVDKAEEDVDFARALNAVGPANLAAECLERGVPLVHISTDFVFFGDGSRPMREDDPKNPRGVYAITKREGELAIENSGCQYLIARTAWLYGKGGRNFPDTMLSLARTKDVLTVVDDQKGSPTYTEDLAAALLELVEKGARGYFHVTNHGEATWFDLACAAIDEGFDMGLLDRKPLMKPVTTGEFPRPAPRPAYSVMCLDKFKSLTGHYTPEWREALRRYLKSLRES